MENEIVLYQPNDAIHLEVRMTEESVWLNRNQMSVLFGRDVKTIGKHINNALHEELRIWQLSQILRQFKMKEVVR